LAGERHLGLKFCHMLSAQGGCIMQCLIVVRILGVCSLFCLFLSTAWADQVALKNGDRLTGSVIKMDGKNLTVKTDQVGAVVVPRDQVASIVIEKPIHIALKDGRALLGTLTSSDEKTEIVTDQAKVSISPSDITTIRNEDEESAFQRLLHPGWGQLWAGTGTIGFAGTAGNARTLTFTTGINAARATRTDKTALYFSLIKASARINDKSQDTAEAIRGGISYGHDVNARLFVSGFNDYEYDRFQNLDLRFVVGGGLGFHALKTERSSLDLVAGAGYNRSKFSTPLIRESGEIYWGDEYSLKLNSAASLVQSYRMFNDITHTGMYRVNFDLGMSTKIFKWLAWNVSISDRYLSDPAPGRKTNDFLYTTGLGITFAK
jgi:putative salt-induced outer membrane protein YdiY